jgi:hypothetical protein
LNRNTIDHNDQAYESFLEILAVLSFHRRANSSQKIFHEKKKHKLTTLGKCILHNERIQSVVHVSLEAYVFIYLKGKMQLSPKFYSFFQGPNVERNADRLLLESVKEMSDVVHFLGKAKKGENLPEERNGAEDKLVWTWTDPIYDTYKRLMGELMEYNRESEDKFFFPDLTNEALANYEATNRVRDDHHTRKSPVKNSGECVRRNTDLRIVELYPATNDNIESDDKYNETWLVNFKRV